MLAALKAEGVAVTGSRLRGTTLDVYVPSASDLAAVGATGATAVVGTPPAEAAPSGHFRLDASSPGAATSPGAGTSPLLGGDAWAYTTDSYGDGIACSVGFLGYSASSGAREFATAGHCADPATTGDSGPGGDPNGVDGSVYSFEDTSADPEDNSNIDASPGDALGVLSTSEFHFGDDDDYGTVPVTSTKAHPQNAVTTWGGTGAGSPGGSTGVQNAGTPVQIVGATQPLDGAPVCHSGGRTGWQCGVVTNSQVTIPIDTGTSAGSQTVTSFVTSFYVCEGDSGGSIISGQYAVGTLTGGSWWEPSDGECVSQAASTKAGGPGESVGFPLLSTQGGASFARDDADFQLGVVEPTTTPVVTVDESTASGTVSGVLAFADGAPAAAGTALSFSLDGGAAVTTNSAANSHGAQAWSFAASGLTPGAHSYTVTIGSGYSAVTHSGTFQVPGLTISGTPAVGHHLTASAATPAKSTASVQWYDQGASGSSSTPISGARSAQFTPGTSLAGHRLMAEFTAVEPQATVAVISPDTAPLTEPSVKRVAGSDRYGTAVAASQQEFPSGAGTVFLASGVNYPDALAAAPAAAKLGADLLLTAPGSLPSAVSSELKRLHPSTVYIVGGTAAVSAAVASAIKSDTGVSPARVYGADRYATSAAIAARFFPSAQAAFVATGLGFPDALSGASAASAQGDPVLLVPGTGSAPSSAVTAQLDRLKPGTIYVVGGTAVVSGAMQSALDASAPTVRLAGADRYGTSVAVGKQFYTSSAQAVLASGLGFPDALVGSVLAGTAHVPLYLAETGCIPGSVADELTRIGDTSLVLMGGTASLSSDVASDLVC